MPGPPPNPSSARSARRRKALVALPGGLAHPSPLPEWSADIAGAWTRFWSSPLARHVIEPDLQALRRLFGLYHKRAMYAELGDGETLVTGSTGQQVLNPLLKEIDTLDGKILALEDRFGLTPLARLKLQVVLGDAHRSLSETNARIAAAHPGEAEADDPRELVGG